MLLGLLQKNILQGRTKYFIELTLSRYSYKFQVVKVSEISHRT